MLPGFAGAGLWMAVDRDRVVVRDLLRGHPLAETLPRGSVLIAVEGEPTWIYLERVRRTVAHSRGMTSEHSFWAVIGHRFFWFDGRGELSVEFLLPDGQVAVLTLAPMGAKSRRYVPTVEALPLGVTWAEGATASIVPHPHAKQLGYLRVTSPIDARTRQAFDATFDLLQGIDALVLDLRGIGGEDHAAAVAMAGRLQPREFPLDSDLTVVPTGEWQFDGPLIVLQDEAVVDAGETFIWALIENRRAITVGRRTGGWTLTTSEYSCPSGLTFRLGTGRRSTNRRGQVRWGMGTLPDIPLPSGFLFQGGDPLLEICDGIISLRVAELSVVETVSLFSRLFRDGNVSLFDRNVRKEVRVMKLWNPKPTVERYVENLTSSGALELRLLSVLGPSKVGPAKLQSKRQLPPDARGGIARAKDLIPRLRLAGHRPLARQLDAAVSATLRDEAGAQAALLQILDEDMSAPAKEAHEYVLKYDKTVTGQWAKTWLSK
jgi:hypothetical protein